MRTSIKDAGFALFFLLVIALVAVEAADDGTTSMERTEVALEVQRSK